jgi:hypothetical protein
MADRPDIVIAGFPKAGTTALATLLAGHSQVALIEPKEPHRFSWGLEPDLPARARANALSAADYAAAVAAARRRGRLVIDASTSYTHPAVIEGTARRLKEACPNLRVILTVRDPRKRLVSDWRMRHAEGWAESRLSAEVRRNLTGLSAAVGAADDADLIARLAASRDWMGPDRPAGRGTITVVAGGFYDPLIAVYRQTFGDALLVIPQEALRRQPEQVLARCFTHLGLDPEPVSDADGEFNVGDHRVETGLSRLLRRTGVAWAARTLLPHALVARVRHGLTRAPEPGIDDLAGSPEAAVVEQLYALLSAQTETRMAAEFGVRWGLGNYGDSCQSNESEIR